MPTIRKNHVWDFVSSLAYRLLLSLITAPLGAFVVWRKMAYFGDTLSHSALLGVALGIFLQINPYVAIVILTIILAVLMVWLESNTQFSVDTL